MTSVVGVKFKNAGKMYYFSPGEMHVEIGDNVIVETARGLEFGTVCLGEKQVDESELVAPLKSIIRVATENDYKKHQENLSKKEEALRLCQEKIDAHKLEMKLIDVEYTFDNSKVVFYFTADGRVDFRELVKDLAAVFRMRIELRQIGARDEAKMIGGVGNCGRGLCCNTWLRDFEPVSIKMAKVQNLSLNPTKISGICGRLMCCLKYEQEAYEDLLKTAPKNESFVDTPDGRGTVTEVNLLRQSVKVRMEDHPETIGSYNNCDICVLRSGKARKNDPPIPKDLAPISSQPRRKPKEDFFDALPDVIYPDAVAVIGEPEQTPAPQADVPAEPAAARTGRRRRRGRGRGKGEPGETQNPQSAAPAQPKPAGEPSPKPKAPRQSRPQPRPEAQQPVPEAGGQPKPRKPRRRYRSHRGGQSGAEKSE